MFEKKVYKEKNRENFASVAEKIVYKNCNNDFLHSNLLNYSAKSGKNLKKHAMRA
jgi:hypothetical protein